VIVDASALYAFFVRNSADHWGVVGRVELTALTEELVVSAFAIAEVHALIGSRIDGAAQQLALKEFARGAWAVAPVSVEHLGAMQTELERHPSMSLGQASSLVLAADRGEDLLTAVPGDFPALSADGRPVALASDG
jgi:PIN domain nuclease of toxin-antitoxin system